MRAKMIFHDKIQRTHCFRIVLIYNANKSHIFLAITTVFSKISKVNTDFFFFAVVYETREKMVLNKT